jgi:hypothetical protein
MKRILVRYRTAITWIPGEYFISFKLPVLRYTYKHISKNGTDRANADVNDKVKIINQLLYWESKSRERTTRRFGRHPMK